MNSAQSALVDQTKHDDRVDETKHDVRTRTTETMATATTMTLTTTDVVMAEDTAVAAIPASEGALLADVRPPSSWGNPFINYFISKRDETKAANPNASFNDIKAIILNEWCKLPKEEQAKYKYEFESVQAEGELVWQSVLSLVLPHSLIRSSIVVILY
jgi:hypothetical protein